MEPGLLSEAPSEQRSGWPGPASWCPASSVPADGQEGIVAQVTSSRPDGGDHANEALRRFRCPWPGTRPPLSCGVSPCFPRTGRWHAKESWP